MQHQSRGFETSVDIARRQTYTLASIAGQKRAFTSEDPVKAEVKHDRQEPLGNQQWPNEEILESTPLESARALLNRSLSRFTASAIHPGPGAPSAEDRRPRAASVPPGSSQNPLLSLENPKYGLPAALINNFQSLGVKTIYAWQASCLLARGLLSGERHLVYTAPTGGGKSLVADVLLLKRIIENPTRKAILVLPYVALVQEKLKWMRRIVQGVEKLVPDDNEEDSTFPHMRWKKLQKNIRVTGFFGGSRTTTTWADTDIAICTIEKVGHHSSLRLRALNSISYFCQRLSHRPTH